MCGKVAIDTTQKNGRVHRIYSQKTKKHQPKWEDSLRCGAPQQTYLSAEMTGIMTPVTKFIYHEIKQVQPA